MGNGRRIGVSTRARPRLYLRRASAQLLGVILVRDRRAEALRRLKPTLQFGSHGLIHPRSLESWRGRYERLRHNGGISKMPSYFRVDPKTGQTSSPGNRLVAVGNESRPAFITPSASVR